MQELQKQYAKAILNGEIDPFSFSFDEYEKQLKKQEYILSFENLDDDIAKVKRYLLEENEEDIAQELDDAYDCESYLDVAENILFEELDSDMAKILINKALNVAQTSSDYVAVAELFIEEFKENTKAKEAYKKALELAQSTVDVLEIADSILDEEHLADNEWGIELYHHAASVAKSFEDFLYVARSLHHIDNESAKEILDIAKGIVQKEDIKQLLELGYCYSQYVADKQNAKELFIQALAQAKEFESFYYILSYIVKADIAEDFFKRVMKITLLSMTQIDQKEKVATLVLEYLKDEKLYQFIKKNSAKDVVAFFAKKDIDDLKFSYAKEILAGNLNPKEIPFTVFVKQSDG